MERGTRRRAAVVVAASAIVLGSFAAAPATAAGGSIAGTVTGPDGSWLRGFRVTALAGGSEVAEDWTDRDGHYELTALPPGSYVVRFDDDVDNFVTEYHDDAPNAASAEPVPVIGNATTHGIDASIEDPWDSSPADQDVSDATGRFYLTGLDGLGTWTFKLWTSAVPGGYTDDDYLLSTQWYDAATTIEDADPVTISLLGPVVADVTLPETGHLTGSLRTASGAEPGRGYAIVHDVHGHWVDTYAVGGTEWQAFAGLPPGTYRVLFQDVSCGEFENWYPAGNSFETAADVVVQKHVETRIEGTFHCGLAALVPPTISGAATVGSTLTVQPGRWNADPVTFTYEWLADGAPVGTGPTYVVRPQDGGRRLVARVNALAGAHHGTADSAPTAPVPLGPEPPGTSARPSTVVATARAPRRGPRRVLVRVTVAAAGVPVSGPVTVQEGARTLRTGTAHDGTVVVRLARPKPGRHTYTVTFAGSDGVLPSSTTVKVRVPRRPQAS